MTAAAPIPNDTRARRLAEAERYLSALDAEAESWCFQTFDDTDRKRGDLARVMHGDLAERFVWAALDTRASLVNSAGQRHRGR